MKKFILLCGMVSILLTGCNGQDKIVNNYEYKISTTNRFNKTGNIYNIDSCNWIEIVDSYTGNIYITRDASSSASGICPLYDENGQIQNIYK